MAKAKIASWMKKVPGKGASAGVAEDKRTLDYQSRKAGSGK